MNKSLNDSLRYLKGIGPRRAETFKKLGVSSIEDLLYYFPKRYEDRTHFIPISELQEGLNQTIKAKVLVKGERRSLRRKGFTIVEAVVADQSGKLTCVWFNQPYIKEYLNLGVELILFGKVERYGKRLQMSAPEFEIILEEGDAALDINRLVPIYSLPEGVTQRHFRRIIKLALDEYLSLVQDFLSFDIRTRNNLFNLAKALLNIHFPEDSQMRMDANSRLSFDEFFLFQLPLALRKLKRKDKIGIAHKIEGKLAEAFISNLPFKLTNAQEKVLAEIKSDMSRPQPMQRLLQGDVGSGKTVVSVVAALFAIQGGWQVALMVPTEILAKQHYEKIRSQGHKVTKSQGEEIKIALLTSSANKKAKEKIFQEIREGTIDLVIGTHALLEENVEFNKLGLVIIDEQHKFGVGQRALLPKKGINPDVLIMTATPIPRTLAITLYGDLDISVINELPAGRLGIKTLSFTDDDRSAAYQIAKEQLKLGHQVYIVYPVIEESYALDIVGAKKMYEDFKSGEFKEYKLGLVHGKLKEAQQDEVMRKFKNRELDILVATTILEVGIDIPNATCMIIEHSQRFGLAQLHQLRGRVGRASYQSFCVLLFSAKTVESEARISAMVKYGDGFRIAEEDLKIRGPGEFFGRRQSGLSELRIANPLTQMQLLKRSREEAIRVIEVDPQLGAKQNLLLKQRLLLSFPEYEKLIMVG